MEGKAIKIFRIQNGWRQKDLAERANLTQARVSLLENGWKPRPDELQALGQALGVEEAQDAKTDTH